MGIEDAVIKEYFRFFALIGSFPGSNGNGHQRPTHAQILSHRPSLIHDIRAFRPDIVVPVGSMAIHELLPEAADNLADIIGKTVTKDPFDCLGHPVRVIPLPHPSGRSSWLATHQDLLQQALVNLRGAMEVDQFQSR
ncbi:MAG TPA: uracil-DNA glycosylase family protein [Candidatus Saccharimonadia bacterium]|nr:uracil-DNA glycosylase family protein [Candidatus Saccharimonadia bacterium]